MGGCRSLAIGKKWRTSKSVAIAIHLLPSLSRYIARLAGLQGGCRPSEGCVVTAECWRMVEL